MPRERIYKSSTDRSAAYMERLVLKGGARKNLILSPEAVAALKLIKDASGEAKDVHVITRLLLDEAARINEFNSGARNKSEPQKKGD